MQKDYYVYILSNQGNSVLYIGVTNDLERRMYEHKNKLCEGFSKKYNLNKLVYYEHTNDVHEALEREKQIKNWKREWKENLIKESNLYWRDLSVSWDIPSLRDAEPSSA